MVLSDGEYEQLMWHMLTWPSPAVYLCAIMRQVHSIQNTEWHALWRNYRQGFHQDFIYNMLTNKAAVTSSVLGISRVLYMAE